MWFVFDFTSLHIIFSEKEKKIIEAEDSTKDHLNCHWQWILSLANSRSLSKERLLMEADQHHSNRDPGEELRFFKKHLRHKNLHISQSVRNNTRSWTQSVSPPWQCMAWNREKPKQCNRPHHTKVCSGTASLSLVCPTTVPWRQSTSQQSTIHGLSITANWTLISLKLGAKSSRLLGTCAWHEKKSH